MSDNWSLLKKELAVYGIRLVNQKICYVYFKDKFVPVLIKRQARILRNRIKQNRELLDTCWKELCEKLQQRTEAPQAIDQKIISVFTNNLKNLVTYSETLFINPNLKDEIRKSLDVDFVQYPKKAMLEVIDYKLTIDWICRTISVLSYVSDMLLVAAMGEEKVSAIKMKVARGVSGPWANLDLPMGERAFPWRDIEEEIEGRQSDIKKQRRYRQGLENYNNDGRVGEGYYWREMRNEPYSWDNRKTDSPYKHY